jgi:endonuclease I
MLFLADAVFNGARSNHPYRSCTAPACEPYDTLENHGQGGPPPPRENANWETGHLEDGSWETWNGRRGDVARAAFYMDVRYEGDGGEPDLILTDNAALIEPTGPGAAEGYMGILSTLLAWHREDPVDPKERVRNEVVYWNQRNRNPFIDHPEWVGCVFEGFCPIFADGFETGDTSMWSGTAP